jgi:hypothetical protein
MGVINEKIAVYLDDFESNQFLEFQKNYKNLSPIIEAKVFYMQFGKAILNIANGQVQNIIIEEVVYRK